MHLDVDIKYIIFKISQYFHIYYVRSEQRKEYCDFVDIQYKKLISPSTTRWLSLCPTSSRMIHIFPALQAKPPKMIQNCFEK